MAVSSHSRPQWDRALHLPFTFRSRMSMDKVLYVEDEPFLSKIVKETLEGRGFVVKLVDDGSHVIAAMNEQNPDICILDVMLPNVDGFSVAANIRKINSQIPIIFVTAKNQLDDLKEGFKSGGNDYLTKPFSIEELILRMDNLLSMVHGNLINQQSNQKQIGKYIYDFVKMELVLDNHCVKLSHRENEILKRLTANLSEPIGRVQILNEVWGNDSFFNSRNLDVYIKKIRDLLKEDPAIEIITLKGFGYRFNIRENHY